MHGLEGSPQGTKATLLAQAFIATTPAMDTSDFEGCVRLQAGVIDYFRPDVIVGSSFGGAVLLALLQRGLWRGPSLLLAQAGLRYGLPVSLPDGVDIWIVHGTGDDIIDPNDSRRLAAAGDDGRVRLIEVNDDHPLRASTGSGQLVRWIESLAGRAGR